MMAALGIAVAAVPSATTFGQFQLTELTRFNLNAAMSAATGTAAGSPANPNYIGNNPSAVAWNGSRLFVAGMNNGAKGTNSQNTGIIEVLNTNTTGIVASTAVQYGTRFGFLSTTINSRGYTGLAMQGVSVFAAFDTGSVQANALRGYDVSASGSANLLWSGSGRGSAGVAIDPGYVVSGSSQGGAGVGWGTFGDGVSQSSNRRALNNPTTGASIYGFNSGSSAPVPAGLLWNNVGVPRDLAFDPASGDIYGRVNNDVVRAVRDGANSTSSRANVWTASQSTTVVGQNIAFMSSTPLGNLLVFNDKDGTAGGLPFAVGSNPVLGYNQVSDTSGTVLSGTWNFLGGTVPTSTAGYYDFSYDPASKTLAVVDASNLRVSIFGFGAPAPDTQLTWAADGVNTGGTGTWDNASTTWIGAYGPSVWQPQANALFSGTSGGTVTVAAGGVSVGRGLSFSANGYTVAGDAISLTGSTASTNNLFVGTGLNAAVNSNLAATSGLSKSGGGTLVIGGTITGGNLSINNGTLAIAPTGAIRTSPGISVLASGTLDVTQLTGGYVAPGGQSLAGAGLVNGSVTMSSGATLSPGSNLGTLTVTNDLTLNGGGNYNWQIVSGTGSAGTSWDLASVGGALTIASTTASPFKINLWSLSGTSPDVNGNAANFDSTQNYTWTIVTATGGISGFAADKFRVNTSGTNGTTGFSNSFGTGTFSLAQSGNNLNLVFTAGAPSVITINVASGTQTQTDAGYPTLSGSVPVVKTGAGTLSITAANTLTGSTTVQQGTLQLANGSALASSKIVPVAGGTVSLTPYLQTTVGGLAPNAGGLVDVGSGYVTVANGLSPADLVTAIVAGRGDGSWTGASGITSSVAAADVASSIPRAVGWLDNGDGSVSFAFAAPGDTNIDWQVDVVDALNFVTLGKFDTGLPASWLEGDFNYDGVVDILDALDFFNTSLYDAGSYNPPAGGAGAVAAVPEPSGLALFACLGGIAVAAGRRRRTA